MSQPGIIRNDIHQIHGIYAVHKVVGVVDVAGRNFAILLAFHKIFANPLHVDRYDGSVVSAVLDDLIEHIEIFVEPSGESFIPRIAGERIDQDKVAVGRNGFDFRNQVFDVAPVCGRSDLIRARSGRVVP